MARDEAKTLQERAITTITDALASEAWWEFYDESTNFAGSTFVGLQPNDPIDITATDLHAVSLLSVRVGPRATRRLLLPGPFREASITALRALPIDARLEDADDEMFARMYAFHDSLKLALAPPSVAKSNQWVTAAKITARKRPALFPVRDRVVGDALGKEARADAFVFWNLLKSALGNETVQKALTTATERFERGHPEGGPGPHTPDLEPLRIIDAALWMAHRRGASVEDAAD